MGKRQRLHDGQQPWLRCPSISQFSQAAPRQRRFLGCPRLDHPFFANRFLFNLNIGRLQNRRRQRAGIQAVALAIFFCGFVVGGFNLAGTPAAHRFFLFRRFIRGDIVAIIAIVAIISFIALWTILLRLGTAALIVTIIVAIIILAIATIVAAIVRAIIATIVRSIVTTIVSARFFAGDPLFFAAGNRIGVDPEIMIGKLMIIFGLDAVAIDLRVLRHFLEFIEHLHSIAACAIVYPVIAVRSATAVALGTIIGVPAAPTAAGLTIVHQFLGILIPLINLVFLKS